MDTSEQRGTTERVLTLLGLLQQRRAWSGPELAARLGVTTRTVRRDVERLRALGYPVHAGQGVGGGYRLGPGQVLPPLLLDDEEAIATAVSLLAGTAAGTGDATLRALTKLDQVLPTRLRHEVRALSGSVEFFGTDRRTPVDPEVLMTLARACRDEVEADFGYPSGEEVRQRRVEPHRLVASDRRWYLLAYDLDRDDWRTFRVDRMTAVSARTWRFDRRAAPDAAEYVQEGVASRVYPRRARFLVHAPADTVRAQVPPSAAVVHERGRSTARCSAVRPTWTACSCTSCSWATTSRSWTRRTSGSAAGHWRRSCCRPGRRARGRPRRRRGRERRVARRAEGWEPGR